MPACPIDRVLLASLALGGMMAAVPGHAAPAAVPVGISETDLAPPDPDAAGALVPGDRGLPPSLWDGMSGALVMSIMPRIAAPGSPALADLGYRLLASPGAPPAGIKPRGAFLAMRASRLTDALGRPDAAYFLVEAGIGLGGADAERVAVDLAFLAGDEPRACARIRDHKGADGGAFWDEGHVTCDALDGNADDTRLGLEMLRENSDRQYEFVRLVEAYLGGGLKSADTLPPPQSMTLALLAKAGVPLSKKLLDTADPAVLRAVALGSGFPDALRLDAAERATAMGALEPARLAEAYLALHLNPAEKDAPLKSADAAGGARGRAILFAAASSVDGSAQKAPMLAALLARAPRGEIYIAVAGAAQEQLLSMAPSPDLSSDATDVARALIATGHSAEANGWLAVAAPDDAAQLAPLVHIATGAGIAVEPGGGRPAGDGEIGRALLAAELETALGDPLPGDAAGWLYAAKAQATSPVPILLIHSEAAQHHVGGTVLAVVAALGGPGGMAATTTVAEAVSGLRAVGMTDEARRLATDAAILGGL